MAARHGAARRRAGADSARRPTRSGDAVTDDAAASPTAGAASGGLGLLPPAPARGADLALGPRLAVGAAGRDRRWRSRCRSAGWPIATAGPIRRSSASSGCSTRSRRWPFSSRCRGLLHTRILDTINVVVALTIYSVALLVRVIADALASVPARGPAGRDRNGISRRCSVSSRSSSRWPIPVITAGLRVAIVSNVSMVAVAAILVASAELGQLFTIGIQLQLLPTDHSRHPLVRRAGDCPRPAARAGHPLGDAVAPGGEPLMFFSGVWDFLTVVGELARGNRHPAARPRSPAVFGHRAGPGRADRTAARAADRPHRPRKIRHHDREHAARAADVRPAGLFPDRLLEHVQGQDRPALHRADRDRADLAGDPGDHVEHLRRRENVDRKPATPRGAWACAAVRCSGGSSSRARCR